SRGSLALAAGARLGARHLHVRDGGHSAAGGGLRQILHLPGRHRRQALCARGDRRRHQRGRRLLLCAGRQDHGLRRASPNLRSAGEPRAQRGARGLGDRHPLLLRLPGAHRRRRRRCHRCAFPGMTAPPRLPTFYRLVAFDAIDSTNEEAKRRAREGAAEGLLVWAKEQLAGRGRRGRSFASPPGNLYMSVLLRPERTPVAAAQLSFAAALAVGEAAAALLPDAARLRYKWPNDVLVDGRKLSGVLLESQASSEGRLDWLVIGMGVNLASHPDGLEFPAISLAAAGAVVTVEGLLVAVAERFLFWDEHWRRAGVASLREPWLGWSP